MTGKKNIFAVSTILFFAIVISISAAIWLHKQTNNGATAEQSVQGDSSSDDATSELQEHRSEQTIVLPGGVKLKMVEVEVGTFEMSAKDGENDYDELPHHVTLTKSFYIGQTEVTQAQWKAIMGSNPSYFKGDNLPVECVSWNHAMEFCEKLNSMGKAPSGWKFTLPTETQWEYAARGGNKSCGYKYSGSNSIDAVAWYYANSGDNMLNDSSWDYDAPVSNHCKTHPVGQKQSNELGLYDMSGNVWEWCLDDWKYDSNKLIAEFTRDNDNGGSNRALRGGSWRNQAKGCRVSRRGNMIPHGQRNLLGFRIALVPGQHLSKTTNKESYDSESGTETVDAFDGFWKQAIFKYQVANRRK